jgi:hypothetical protein
VCCLPDVSALNRLNISLLFLRTNIILGIPGFVMSRLFVVAVHSGSLSCVWKDAAIHRADSDDKLSDP